MSHTPMGKTDLSSNCVTQAVLFSGTVGECCIHDNELLGGEVKAQ